MTVTHCDFLCYRHLEISRGCGFIFTCVYTDDLLQFLCKFEYSVVLAESLCTKLYIQSPYKAIHSASYVYTGRLFSQAQHCDFMAVHLQKKFILPKSLSVTCTLSVYTSNVNIYQC